MNKQIKEWIEKSKSDKDFTKNLIEKTLSDVIGKRKPTSLKLKVKFDKEKKELPKKHKRNTPKKERIF